MDDAPDYVMIGRGRWATRMHGVLEELGRRVTTLAASPRRQPDTEEDDHYEARMVDTFAKSGASVAWLCVAPGPHVSPLVRAALSAGMHVLAEKPWPCSEDETAALTALARRAGRAVGVHFEYCLLDDVQRWRDRLNGGDGLEFGGRFVTPAADRMGISAVDNLGCHLRAIRQYAVPHASIAEITCGYERPAERLVWVWAPGRPRQEIDFLHQSQPIIQRFVALFEEHLGSPQRAEEFPFDMTFALRTATPR
jgi:hypothetical protein